MWGKKLRKLGIRGQAGDFGVGGLIALLILIAIGALVLYSVTEALDRTEDSYADNASDGVYLETISLSLHGFTTPATFYLAVMAYNTPQPTTYTLTLKNQP